MSNFIERAAVAGAKARRGVTAKVNDTDRHVARSVLAEVDVFDLESILTEHTPDPVGEYGTNVPGGRSEWWKCPACGVETEPSSDRNRFFPVEHQAKAIRDYLTGVSA